MPAIGLSGFAQVGKTTAALYLQDEYGFRRKHIATPLRAMIAELMRANSISNDMIHRYLEGDLKDGVIIPEFGCTSRHLQITIGTQWGREQVNPNLWSDTWKRSVQSGEMAMNDSVRFRNEESAIEDLGGFSILIRRKGTGPVAWKKGYAQLGPFLYKTFGSLVGAHDSERTDRLSPKYIIDNDASIDALHIQLDQIMAEEGFARLDDLIEMAA